MMETVLNDSEWIDIDTWEISQPRIQPVATVANHLIELLREKIPGHKSLSLCVVTTAAAMIRSPLAGFDKKVVSVCVVGTANEKEKVDPIRENYEKNQGIKMYYATSQDSLLTGDRVADDFKNGNLKEEQVDPRTLKYVQLQLLGGYALKDSDL
jgi:hypothetical protein